MPKGHCVSVFLVGATTAQTAATATLYACGHARLKSLFVWLWLVVNDRKFSAGTIFFSHTNQSAVLLHEPATIRTSQPNRLHVYLPKLFLLLLEHPKFQKNLYLQGRCSHADKSWRWNDLYSVSSTAKAQMDAL